MNKVVFFIIVTLLFTCCKKDSYYCSIYIKNSLTESIFLKLITKTNDTLIHFVNTGDSVLLAHENYLKYQPNEIFSLYFKTLIIKTNSFTYTYDYHTTYSINPFINRSLWKYKSYNKHTKNFVGKTYELWYELSIRDLCKVNSY